MKNFFSTESRSHTPAVNIKSWFDYCAILQGNKLVANGWAWHPDAELTDISLKLNEDNIAIKQYKIIRGTRKDVNEHFGDTNKNSRWGMVLIVELAESIEISEDTHLEVTVKTNTSQTSCHLPAHESTSLEPFRQHIRILQNTEQAETIKTLIDIFGQQTLQLAKTCFQPTEQLEHFVRLEVEKAYQIPGVGVFVYGWLMDTHDSLEVLQISSGNQVSNNLLDNIPRTERFDVLDAFSEHAKQGYKPGFYLLANVDIPENINQADFVYLTKTGELARTTFNISPITDLIEVSKHILVNFRVNEPNYMQNLANHIGPALTALWAQRPKLNASDITVKQFGDAIANPECSVIVPIYGRYDFVLYQLAQFVDDADFKTSELIYVLDDPRIYNEFMHYCAALAPIFQIPFTVVYGGRNLGYAGANNLGVKQARGQYLLLLNSDVIPSESGWLNRMVTAYETNSNTGILGTKLVFEDETIQHNGLTYHQTPQFGDLWLVDHPGKGLPEWMADQYELAEVPAVTGACMMIHKDIYVLLDGLDESYILGDFEDSDLCMKSLQLGYSNYLLGTEKLYHLERQSQKLFDDNDWKFKLTIFNGWQHTHRWAKAIEHLNKPRIKLIAA